ncbi:aldehyde dehydrogenase family protein [Nesterenkonia pannonica]|uniref:aldehyde dehydrogenase family protein n=1 Tax=Nesterenkonia pannonica TaxID=1548602 RepID=UPI002164E8CA|nr:aldehyde dehydrogenase family protein [Nesterenkonia pannonica]
MTATAEAPLDLDPELLISGAQLIGGEWVPASSGETIEVINPANGNVIATIPRSDAADVDLAVQAAEKALPPGAISAPRAEPISSSRGRTSWSRRSKSWTSSSPKKSVDPRGAWFPWRASFASSPGRRTRSRACPSHPLPDTLGFTLREPFGVVGAIIPWNAPGPCSLSRWAPPLRQGTPSSSSLPKTPRWQPLRWPSLAFR